MKSKRILAMLLAMGMVFSVAACGGEKSDTSSDGAANSEAKGGEEAVDEEPYTVAIQVVTLPGTQFEGEAEREEAINAITVPAINCKVDIQEIWISEINTKTSMAIASDEKIDLIHAATVQPLSSLVGSDMLFDMNTDNILQEHGADLVELMGDVIKSGEVSGKQLAIPAKTLNASGKGVYYNKTIADACGVTLPETGCTMEQLEEAFYTIKEKQPDVMPWFSGNGENNFLYWMRGYTGFGQQCSYGVILDENKNHTVENYYASDVYKDFVLMMNKWTRDGIQPGDSTDTNSSQSYFQAGKLFAVPSDINEMIKAQTQADNPDFEVGFAQMVEPMITSASVTEYMWAIASTSERPEKAMDFLNLLYTNGEVANILKYGIKDVNYSIVEGTDNVVAVNGSYIPAFYNGGNERTMYIQAPAGADYIEKREAMEESAYVSDMLSYMFDDTDYQTESSAIYSTILEYIPRLSNGTCKDEAETLALLDEFNAKLSASGIDDVIAGNQEQLDAYLSSK